MNTAESLRFFIPELFLLTGAFFLLAMDLFVSNKKFVGMLGLIVLAGTGLLTQMPHGPLQLFGGMFTLDRFTHFFRLTALGIVGITVLVSLAYHNLSKQNQGEYYSLFIFMAFALILMASASNLLMIFLSIEFVSILSYLLVGFLKKDPRAKEAAIKYFLFGSLSTGTMLFGMSLLFGMSGSLELSKIAANVTGNSYFPAAVTALVFFLTGLGFKISMAPFHMWAPDVYEAAPTPVTAFLTVGPKALGFAVLIRVLSTAFYWLNWKWTPLLMALSMLTMTIGNVVAISQTNIKRLLAYSSIAQAGYLLMGLCVFNEMALTGILIYLLAYAMTNLGAFTCVMLASNELKSDDLQSYAGLAKRAPFLAFSFTVFLLSLAGIPPVAGFLAKFYMFSSAINAHLNALAVVAALNSAVAAYYYFKIVRLMYLVEPVHTEPIPQTPVFIFTLCLLLAGILVLGLMPEPFITAVRSMLLS